MKISVALSGGVDSLASLHLLYREGHDLLPVHARLFPEQDPGEKLAQHLDMICRDMGLSLHILDLTQHFSKIIIEPFIQDYLQGKTPNPCALCNKKIKFGLLLDRVREMGAGALATGHYARVQKDEHGTGLWRGRDPSKDQSYFLSLVPEKSLEKAIFPLQNKHKTWVINYLGRENINPPGTRESSEVCFIHGDYREMVAGNISSNNESLSGPIKNSQGATLGLHSGLWRYTPGQRRGLGIAWSYPLYVIGKDQAANTLLVGTRNELGSRGCLVREINQLVPTEKWPDRLWVQTRYRQSAQPADVHMENGCMQVYFIGKTEVSVPGQVAAVYSRDGRVLAGGIIEQEIR